MTQVFMLAYQSRNMWHGSCGHKLCRHVSNTLCRLLFCILNHQAGKKRRKTAAKQRKSYIHKCKVSMHYSALIYLRVSDIFLSMKNLFILISLCFTGMFCQDIFSLNYVSAIKQAWFPHRDTMHAAFLHWPVINCACIIQKSTLVYKYKYFHFSSIYVFFYYHTKFFVGKESVLEYAGTIWTITGRIYRAVLDTAILIQAPHSLYLISRSAFLVVMNVMNHY